ncbi:alpha-L-fucosidase [Luteipulveratus mongoliensis]|uniref:alpha-L-fucosidase n=1 Tax=Luteipulveratus mongoliensis TaxID=571913 RepID=UPI000696FEF9|nr:alpha-L-fucosidase [Luteipulveratus mongoliensis]
MKLRRHSRRTTLLVAALATTALTVGTVSSSASATSVDPVPPHGSTSTPDYEPNADSLDTHPVPSWFNDDKFGIFIHWGAYSVPAWGPRGSYAEWYWNYMNTAGTPTNDHHRATFGIGKTYDSFIDDWKAEKYKPADWVKLFNDAGAKYFVLTSKHHEGVALWDTKTSTRDVVDRGPHRDLAGDLFKAARKDGRLKAGFYYSLYEWNNPNYTGKPVTNPYTGQEIPYTGVEPTKDYVHTYMQPQLKELVDQYDPDIIWCDGQWDKPASYWDMAPVIADYYNKAKNRPKPKEVAVANRCKTRTGDLDSPELDFQTPEYTVKDDIDPVKWEASRGIAHSYGYNSNEPESDYLTSDQLIDSLSDIVSKNGNLLLDIGPKADGTIPDLMQSRLRDMGSWLGVNGEAIYGTTYFNHAEDKHSNVPVRYTVKDGNLYAIAQSWPGAQLTLGGDLPFAKGTQVKVLGGDGKALPWQRAADGTVHITAPARGTVKTDNAFVFKISTPGVKQLVRARFDVPPEIVPGTSAKASVALTNTGRTPITHPLAKFTAPAGWKVTPATGSIGTIPPGATVTVPITISVPEGSARGSYDLSVTTSGGKVSTTATTNVNVQLPNLALGKAASQASTAYDAPAGRAVDGNTNGSFGSGSVTHTAEPSSQAWWQVDLGASRSLTETSIWNRTDCCADRLAKYWILSSDNPITANSLEEARATPGVTAVRQEATAGRPTTVPLKGVKGRYVRIQLESTTNPLALAEVQIR